MKPGDFMLGVVDFFGALVPGAILVGAVEQFYGQHLPTELRWDLAGETSAWVVRGVLAFIVGNAAFFLGSALDGPYDLYRKAKWPPHADRAYERANELRERALGDRKGAEVMSAFQWSKAVLSLEKRDALGEVEQHEASSKFFRSLMVVLLCLTLVLLERGHWRYGLGAFALSLASFFPYADRRYKSTRRAYELVVTLKSPAPKEA